MSTTAPAFGGVPAKYSNLDPAQWWYAYKTNKGAFGITRSTAIPSGAVQTVFIGVGKNLIDLATNFGTQTSTALHTIGADAKTQTALIAQLDSGSILHNPTFVEAKPTRSGVKVTSNKPTTIQSEANPVNVIPSPIDPNVGNDNLSASLSGISNFFSMLSNISLWKGVGLVVAGVLILILAGVLLVKGGV